MAMGEGQVAAQRVSSIPSLPVATMVADRRKGCIAESRGTGRSSRRSSRCWSTSTAESARSGFGRSAAAVRVRISLRRAVSLFIHILVRSRADLPMPSYMPLAVSALSAAAASANRFVPTRSTSATVPGERAEQVPESIEMPVPMPTPSPRSGSESSLRSRTYLQAQQQAGLSAGRFSMSSQGRSVSTPSGRISAHSSDESMASGNGKDTKWNGEMSYEQIGRDEAADIPPSGVRPGMEKRRSSWWGWGGGAPGERDKAE